MCVCALAVCIWLRLATSRMPNSLALSLTLSLHVYMRARISHYCVCTRQCWWRFFSSAHNVYTHTHSVRGDGGGHWFWRVSIWDEEMMRALFARIGVNSPMLIDMRLLFHAAAWREFVLFAVHLADGSVGMFAPAPTHRVPDAKSHVTWKFSLSFSRLMCDEKSSARTALLNELYIHLCASLVYDAAKEVPTRVLKSSSMFCFCITSALHGQFRLLYIFLFLRQSTAFCK